MRMKLIVGSLIALVVVAGLTALWVLWPKQPQTAPTELAATVVSTDATQPKLHLKNISNRACQVATTAEGTVAITRLVQRGKLVQPEAVDSAHSEDVGYLLQDQLKTLQPGESQDITLPVYKLSAGYVLHTTTWSSGAGSLSAEYIITGTDPLQMDLGYNLPVATNGAPACAAVFVSNIGEVPPAAFWSMLGGGIVLVILLVAGGWWLWRHKHQHQKKIKTVLFVMAAVGLSWCGARAVLADVVVPPELQADYNSCIAVFNANRDITGPVLDILNNPANHFEIVHTHGVGSDMTGRRSDTGTGGIFRIYWNPDDHHRYVGTGGFPDKCSVLYHELYHALDQLNGTFSRDDCAGSGIETKEVMATRAQNALRVRLGLPPRSHYGDRPLPSGDCRGTARPTACTGDRCGETNGDPHLFTFDGLRYDFQAAGEFIASRTKSGDFEIQVRQEPWTNSRHVSINTAIAFKMGSDKVEIRSGQKLVLLVNGKIQAQSAVTVSGGHVEVTEDATTLTWQNGSVAYVRPVGNYGVALSVQPSNELAGKLEGLLGDADGSSKNDLHARDSTTNIEPTFKQLYPVFADSWRITGDASLFTYENGNSTNSYTRHNFPEEPIDAKSLPGYAAAEAICKSYGVTDPAVLANCALDVAITGRPEFARAAAHSQAFTTGLVTGAITWQLVIKDPGDRASATFDAKANEKIFINVLQSTLPSQCGTLRLLGPDKTEVANGCIINGKGAIDGTVLPVDGTYTVALSAGSSSTGSAAIRLLRITDRQAAITPDGPSLTATIDQPGVVGRYTFNGQAGQYVYIDIPASTLDSQCGVLRLLGPDGHELTSGCIINHVGYIDTTRLPTTGQYTIVVDPNATTIGQLQMRLVLPTAETVPVVIDGQTVTVALKKQGSFATLTFNGVAGQRVYVDLPTSELPSQCGLLTLRAAGGREIASGCVINHKGNINDDGIVLPTTGQYVITLDPGAGDTGTTTVRLRSH